MTNKNAPKVTKDKKAKAAPAKRSYNKKKKKAAKKIAKKRDGKDPDIEVVRKGSTLTVYIFR